MIKEESTPFSIKDEQKGSTPFSFKDEQKNKAKRLVSKMSKNAKYRQGFLLY